MSFWAIWRIGKGWWQLEYVSQTAKFRFHVISWSVRRTPVPKRANYAKNLHFLQVSASIAAFTSTELSNWFPSLDAERFNLISELAKESRSIAAVRHGTARIKRLYSLLHRQFLLQQSFALRRHCLFLGSGPDEHNDLRCSFNNHANLGFKM